MQVVTIDLTAQAAAEQFRFQLPHAWAETGQGGRGSDLQSPPLLMAQAPSSPPTPSSQRAAPAPSALQLGKPQNLYPSSIPAEAQVAWIGTNFASVQAKQQLVNLIPLLKQAGFEYLATDLLPRDARIAPGDPSAAERAALYGATYGPGSPFQDPKLLEENRRIFAEASNHGMTVVGLGLPPAALQEPRAGLRSTLVRSYASDVARLLDPARAEQYRRDGKVAAVVGEGLLGYEPEETANQLTTQLGRDSVVIQVRHGDTPLPSTAGSAEAEQQRLLQSYAEVLDRPFWMQVSGYPRPTDLKVSFPDPSAGPSSGRVPAGPPSPAEEVLGRMVDNFNRRSQLTSQPSPDRTELQQLEQEKAELDAQYRAIKGPQKDSSLPPQDQRPEEPAVLTEQPPAKPPAAVTVVSAPGTGAVADIVGERGSPTLDGAGQPSSLIRDAGLGASPADTPAAGPTLAANPAPVDAPGDDDTSGSPAGGDLFAGGFGGSDLFA